VVWVRYQATEKGPFAPYPANAQAAWYDALYRLQNFWWENHVKPQVVNGSIQTIIVGHSFGGWIGASLAAAAPTAVPSIPVPLAMVLIEPASLGLLPNINFPQISPSTQMVIVSSDQDTVACEQDGVTIFESTTQIPAANKNYLFFHTDNTGTPNQVGNHYYPNTDGYKDTAAIDARDFFVTWKLSVAAADCLTQGLYCDYFIGNGSADQTGMGNWSNGQAVTPMSYYADPTQLPPIPGCVPVAKVTHK
jgi:pimeloyl-ACP methyl ester carboxylesterase